MNVNWQEFNRMKVIKILKKKEKQGVNMECHKKGV